MGFISASNAHDFPIARAVLNARISLYPENTPEKTVRCLFKWFVDPLTCVPLSFRQKPLDFGEIRDGGWSELTKGLMALDLIARQLEQDFGRAPSTVAGSAADGIAALLGSDRFLRIDEDAVRSALAGEGGALGAASQRGINVARGNDGVSLLVHKTSHWEGCLLDGKRLRKSDGGAVLTTDFAVSFALQRSDSPLRRLCGEGPEFLLCANIDYVQMESTIAAVHQAVTKQKTSISHSFQNAMADIGLEEGIAFDQTSAIARNVVETCRPSQMSARVTARETDGPVVFLNTSTALSTIARPRWAKSSSAFTIPMLPEGSRFDPCVSGRRNVEEWSLARLEIERYRLSADREKLDTEISAAVNQRYPLDLLRKDLSARRQDIAAWVEGSLPDGDESLAVLKARMWESARAGDAEMSAKLRDVACLEASLHRASVSVQTQLALQEEYGVQLNREKRGERLDFLLMENSTRMSQQLQEHFQNSIVDHFRSYASYNDKNLIDRIVNRYRPVSLGKNGRLQLFDLINRLSVHRKKMIDDVFSEIRKTMKSDAASARIYRAIGSDDNRVLARKIVDTYDAILHRQNENLRKTVIADLLAIIPRDIDHSSREVIKLEKIAFRNVLEELIRILVRREENSYSELLCIGTKTHMRADAVLVAVSAITADIARTTEECEAAIGKQAGAEGVIRAMDDAIDELLKHGDVFQWVASALFMEAYEMIAGIFDRANRRDIMYALSDAGFGLRISEIGRIRDFLYRMHDKARQKHGALSPLNERSMPDSLPLVGAKQLLLDLGCPARVVRLMLAPPTGR